MFYPIFESLRNVLTPVVGEKAVQWYNNQYESTITKSNIAFIQFKDGLISRLTKQANQLDCLIIVHIVQKVKSDVDGSISDIQLQAHDLAVDKVAESLNGYVYTDGVTKSREIKLVGCEPQQSIGGFLVTLLSYKFTR